MTIEARLKTRLYHAKRSGFVSLLTMIRTSRSG